MALTVSSVSPENESEGQALLQPIEVTFNEAVDPDSIHSGTFVVFSKASKLLATGPVLHAADGSSLLNSDLLASPTFQGIIEGTYSFNTGYTKATFTPTAPLEVNTEYVILLSSEILTRTIGDIVSGYYSDNVGTGSMWVEGPYTGTDADTIVVQVATAGDLTTATFKYFYLSDPTTISAEIPTDYSVALFDNIVLHFETGTYSAGDSWSFDFDPGTQLDELYSWIFATGSGNLVTPPEEVKSTDITGTYITGFANIVTATTALSYVAVTPANDIPILSEWTNFVFEFSKTINTGYDPDNLSIYYTNLQTFVAKDRTKTSVDKTITISGKKITVDLATAIPDNQEVHFVFEDLTSDDGDVLDQEVEFLSNLTPLFITDDRIRLEIGPLVQDVPGQTIYRTIWNFSQLVETFNFTEADSAYFVYLQSEWVTLKSICQLLTLMGTSTGSNTSKTLGDFSVVQKAVGLTASDLQKDACKMSADMLPLIKNGGARSPPSAIFIKGWNDPNRPLFGRSWFPEVDSQSGDLPAGNIRAIYYRRGYITGGDVNSLYLGEDLR